MSIIISTENVTMEYKKDQTILNGITLEIEEGIFMVIVGPSGSGKSTLLNIMSGMLKPTKGSVYFKGEDITKFNESNLADLRRNKIGQIFQNYYLLSHLNIKENINIGLSPSGNNYDIKQIATILGIDNILNSFPSDISGGQQQRVAIARAIIKKPSVLFCDEATGALDEENSKNVISLLHTIRKQLGITVIFVTHNHEVAKTANRILTIKNGSVYSDSYNSNPIEVQEMNWI